MRKNHIQTTVPQKHVTIKLKTGEHTCTLLVVLDFLYIYIALVLLHMIAQREVGNFFFSPPHSTGEYMQVYSYEVTHSKII